MTTPPMLHEMSVDEVKAWLLANEPKVDTGPLFNSNNAPLQHPKNAKRGGFRWRPILIDQSFAAQQEALLAEVREAFQDNPRLWIPLAELGNAMLKLCLRLDPPARGKLPINTDFNLFYMDMGQWLRSHGYATNHRTLLGGKLRVAVWPNEAQARRFFECRPPVSKGPGNPAVRYDRSKMLTPIIVDGKIKFQQPTEKYAERKEDR